MLISHMGIRGWARSADVWVLFLSSHVVLLNDPIFYGNRYTLAFTGPALPAMEGDVLKIDGCSNSSSTVTTNSSEGDLFGSLVNVGCMVGALFGSYLTNRIGRKHSIMTAAIPFAAGYATLAVASAFWLILSARLVTGFAVGIVSMAVSYYFAPPRLLKH